MKVLFPIGALFPSQTGGPANSIYWLAKALHKNGVEVKVITTNRGIAENVIELNKWLSLDYGDVYYCTEFNYSLNLKLIRKTLQNLKETDIVHLTSIFDIPSLIIALFAVFFNKKIVWSVRGELAPKALKIKFSLKKVLLFLVKRIKNKIYFHSTVKQETEYIKSQMGVNQKIIELPNYMDLSQYKGCHHEDDDYFLYLGRIHSIKALENLLEAYSKVNHLKLPNLYLVGTGDQDYINDLEHLSKKLNISDKVFFKGHVAGQKKYNFLKNAKFLILPSFTENFGNVVIEALSQGTPVIASQGTPWQILEIENCGFWVSNDPENLSEIIKNSSELSKEVYKNMRKNAFDLASNNFDINNNVSLWVNAYKEVI
ncbi:MAG: glycosyltransferase [Winogradskyella sp.]|nr:MAG: glycosyltransferase [Winogradskyella sp.]